MLTSHNAKISTDSVLDSQYNTQLHKFEDAIEEGIKRGEYAVLVHLDTKISPRLQNFLVKENKYSIDESVTGINCYIIAWF